MSSVLTKAGLSLAGMGGTGLGGYAIYTYSQGDSRTIKEVLIAEKYTLASSQEAWDKVAKTYALEVTPELKIGEATVNANAIKQWCEEKLKSTDKKSFLERTKKWCVTYSSIRDQLTKDNLTLETEESTLKPKYAQLDSSIKSEVDSFTGEASKDPEGSKLKQWCESRSYRTYIAGDFYNTFKEKCTKSAG
ncbi:hypothetical protein HF1_05440 [Mycoplasma haemofelis str. Langford 1]|uniref:Uncharacterized protein n=1 Tax=Mycoplasma haemofelis (strain Langford 1) TaxID=941640 RepID=E8ZHD1_MYCHL|nr:hypothetical protein [Mycoplasma haemofelis]CBY92552.1 hypothetical protein HF1_05440 [Mycoplasma haemofelis str. Langford 1]